jgi:hypothetical protein
MSWKGNYCLERTDSVRSESLAELIRLFRKAIPNAPSQCCTGQESSSDAAAACCIESLGQIGNSCPEGELQYQSTLYTRI